MRVWFKDKWEWLKTFNRVPVVTITADTIIQIGEDPAITVEGRAEVVMNIETLIIEQE